MKRKYHIIFLLCLLLPLIYLTLTVDKEMIDIIKLFLLNYDFSNILVSLSVLVFCLILELFFLPKKETSLYKLFHPNKSIITDVVVGSFFLFGILSIFKGLYQVGIGGQLPGSDEVIIDDGSWAVFSSPVLHFFLYLLIADFINYWLHRWEHEIGFLWEMHKFHHSLTDFVIISGNRIHPIEKAINLVVLFVPLTLLGAPLETFVGINIVIHFIDKMQHSMIEWEWGWIGRNLIYSPIGHRIHHSKEEEHWDKNYGNIFVFWDKYFGTYYNGENVNKELGVTENWMNKHGVIYDILHSTRLSARKFIKSIKSKKWKVNQN